MELRFAKYEGLGNDFIIVESELVGTWTVERVSMLCDRHRGVGADGVLLLSERGGTFRMDVINADGSEPEMCGNGIRCVALHLARKGRMPDTLGIDTAAGVHPCRVIEGGERGMVEVSMRPASLVPSEIGLAADVPLIDGVLAVGNATLRVTAVSMGNPHAVTFDDVGQSAATLGPLLGAHPSFARGVNAGFARMLDPQRLQLAVFERGAGWTEACGTGACAAAVAAVETGRAARGVPIEVQLPGGALQIVVGAPTACISMTGPASHVFDGVIEL